MVAGLWRLAVVSREVAAEPGRRAKTGLLAGCLQELGPSEGPAAVALLSGESQRLRTGVGPAALRGLPGPAAEASLGVREVERELERIAGVHGAGAQAERRRLLDGLFARATAVSRGSCGRCWSVTCGRGRWTRWSGTPWRRRRGCRRRRCGGR